VNSPRELAEHFFRHEYGRLVATLSRRYGLQELDAIEDAVQSALLSALDAWTVSGVPDNPGGWLFRAARNGLLDDVRQRGLHRRLLEQHARTATAASAPTPGGDAAWYDDLLRMLFVCCDPSIAGDSQVVVALKILCGFEVREIALRLFTSEGNVQKRLSRARDRLRTLQLHPYELHTEQYAARLPAVRTILYLIFTEGFLSSNVVAGIRRELCDEAIRLATLLAQHPVGQTPETAALLALMHLHAARVHARQDGSGGVLLLEEQDRALWDQHQIGVGMAWLARSAEGEAFSRFHAEAAIAAEHCLAPTLQDTRWDRVITCYLLLDQVAPSPLHTLNRAAAVAERDGPAEGLAVLAGLEPPTWLAGSYLWAAVLSDLHGRCGHTDVARDYRELALSLAPSPVVQLALTRRLRAAR
jgi:RNA polymerase sigma factor (sigma-70 family)